MYHISSGNCPLREQRVLLAGRGGKDGVLDSFNLCLRKGFPPLRHRALVAVPGPWVKRGQKDERIIN